MSHHGVERPGGFLRSEGSEALRIRPMEAADLLPVQEIEREAFSTPWSVSSFRSLLHRAEVLLRVLEAPGIRDGGGAEIIGYGVLWCVGTEGELANLAITRSVRGRGIGAFLLDALIDEARERGVRSVFLEVRASNEEALGLYDSREFREVGRRRGYYSRPREDALVLAKEL